MKKFCLKETTVFSFLEENGYSRKKIKLLFRYQKVLVEDKIAKYDDKLFPSMKVEVLPFYKPIDSIDILFENKELIVVNKPAGLLTIATNKEKENTLYHLVLTYLKKKDKRNYLFVVHRLDKDTSGVVLFAKNRKLKDAFQANWNYLAKERIYLALVHGILPQKSGVIRQYLREGNMGMVSLTEKDYGKKAITSYKVLKKIQNDTFLEVSIQTGRKNQIRIAFSSIGHPLLGDKKYGKKDGAKRLYLHAFRLTVIHPFTHKKMIFSAKIPEEFDKILKKV